MCNRFFDIQTILDENKTEIPDKTYKELCDIIQEKYMETKDETKDETKEESSEEQREYWSGYGRGYETGYNRGVNVGQEIQIEKIMEEKYRGVEIGVISSFILFTAVSMFFDK